MRILRWLEAVAVAAVCAFGVYAITESRKEDKKLHENSTLVLEELRVCSSQMESTTTRLNNSARVLQVYWTDQGIVDPNFVPGQLAMTRHQVESLKADLADLKAQLEKEKQKK